MAIPAQSDQWSQCIVAPEFFSEYVNEALECISAISDMRPLTPLSSSGKSTSSYEHLVLPFRPCGMY